MSEIQKCPNLARGGVGPDFSKMSQIKKCPKCRKGEGSTLIGTCPKFSCFSILTPPLATFCFIFNFWLKKKRTRLISIQNPFEFYILLLYLVGMKSSQKIYDKI